MNHSRPCPTRHFRAAAAFSLIEILISVLILALGLLGLGALFPVVLREQRIGTDNIQGVLVTANAKAALAQMDLNALLPTGGPSGRDVWTNWRWRSTGNSELDSGSGDNYEMGEWLVADVDALGATEMGDPGSPVAVRLPLASRLHPTAGADGGRPQFVWDIAVHRSPDFDTTTDAIADPLQVAIFIRRIDPRIRVPAGETLMEALLAGTVLPVGKLTGSVLPTLDGTDGSGGLAYSIPIVADRGTDFDLTVDNGTAPHDEGRYINNVNVTNNNGIGRVMAQPNQRLVDNLGNIYTVEGIEADPVNANRSRLRINPPISANLTQSAPANRPRVVQFVFTAHVPAGVTVMEVLP